MGLLRSGVGSWPGGHQLARQAERSACCSSLVRLAPFPRHANVSLAEDREEKVIKSVFIQICKLPRIVLISKKVIKHKECP